MAPHPHIVRLLPLTTLLLLLGWMPARAAADEAQDDEAEAPVATDEQALGPATSSPVTASTQLEFDRPRAELDQRTLRFHSFRDPVIGRSAFAAGSFAFRPGATFARAVEFEDADGPVYDLGLAGPVLDLALGIRLHERVGLRLHGEALAALGTNQASLTNVGGGGLATVDGHLVLVLARTGGTQFSSFLGGAGHFGLLIDPSPYTEVPDVAGGDTGDLVFPDPLTRTRAWDAGGGVALAHAFDRHVALQATLEAAGGAVTDRNAGLSDTDPLLVARGAAAVDLDAWPHVPIAVQFAYGYEHRLRWLETTTVQSRGVHELGGGVFYSGAPQASIGVTGTGRLASSSDPYARLARVDLVFQRYF